MKLTCSKCFGNKTYRGMGSMVMKCEPCNGSGQIELEAKLAPVEEKKASRKPKKGLADQNAANSAGPG